MFVEMYVWEFMTAFSWTRMAICVSLLCAQGEFAAF